MRATLQGYRHAQERDFFTKYQRAFSEALAPYRPKYRNVEIGLQYSSIAVDGPRPIRLPDPKGADGQRLIVEFVDLMAQHFDRLSVAYGGEAGGGVLADLQSPAGGQTCPTLSRFFGAIMFRKIGEGFGGHHHPDDPVILNEGSFLS